MNTTNSILLAEFFSATGYMDRLLFAFSELENFHYGPKGRNQIEKLLKDLNTFFIKEFGNVGFDEEDQIDQKKFNNHIRACHSFIESLIKVPFKAHNIHRIVVNYINMLYRNGYEFHNHIIDNTTLELQYPRSGFIQEENIPSITNAANEKRAPLFFLDEEKLTDYSSDINNSNKNQLSFLQLKREEKYDHYLHRGHYAITHKNYEDAKNNFYKARNYKETAEVLTLLAWTFSLLNNPIEAKSYCLKAVELDTQYGPAYNDFGNYLLAEGQVEESIRWFELAKRAHNYQNREYPYINAGRAYVMLKKYDQALSEFSLALTIAPHHEELHETVSKLKVSLEKSRVQKTDEHYNL